MREEENVPWIIATSDFPKSGIAGTGLQEKSAIFESKDGGATNEDMAHYKIAVN